MTKRTSDPDAKTHAREQLDQINEIIDYFNTQLREVNKGSQTLGLLESVSLGLYEEVDKLSKKAPAEPVTDLVLAQLNDIIRETKQLTDDPYIQRITEFVPAGDNPEQRDAVVVLRQIRLGLERHRRQAEGRTTILNFRVGEARFLQKALNALIYERITLKKEAFGSHLYSDWLTSEYPFLFNHERLADTDLNAYFKSKQ